jgi:ligand-binding SRPBCC domain-containing protein
MPRFTIVTEIRAPIEVCFDLARDIDLHARSLEHTGERAVGGLTSGLIGLGEEVTWEATHFFVRQRLTSRITAFERPRHFRDSQVRGAFKRFDHDHFFEGLDGGCVMKDVFDYTSPMGVVGRIVDWVFLEAYMRRLIEQRARVIKAAGETLTSGGKAGDY